MNRDLDARLRLLKEAGLYRADLVVSHADAGDGQQDALLMVDGQEVINLASNDYLGLSRHPALAAAVCSAVENRQGVGSGASRLVSGTHPIHQELERSLARMLGTERAQLVGSGYLAHVGALPALTGPNDIIYSDALNHASIVDGCRLSRARVRVYGHCDMGQLDGLLCEDAGLGGRRLIITEAVFSMDGDDAPLEDMCQVAQQHGAWIMVDEAHAFGVRGPGGAGLVSALGLQDRVQVRMGTLGKAAGCYGAFLAGSNQLIDFLTNSSRTYIYSTALPLPVAAAGCQALELIQGEEGEPRRQALQQASARLRDGLRAQGWQPPHLQGPILPLKVGDPHLAVDLAQSLLQEGVLVRAMRYPTVARGTERLRLIASAALRPEHLDRTLDAFAGLRRRNGL